MKQTVMTRSGEDFICLKLPDPWSEVVPGVPWQRFEQLFTPAYWRSQAWLRPSLDTASHRLGQTLIQETAACLLGGHGIPAQVGLAAYHRLVICGVLEQDCPTQASLFELLAEPLTVGERQVRYRFANQKSRYLAATLHRLWHETPPEAPLAFRDWFTGCPGIGLKTASWITRNWLGSDEVAIIDIHIQRAGILMGLYDREHDPAKHYREMEEKFLCFAGQVGVRASVLDALMWADMKLAGPLALDMLSQLPAQVTPCRQASPARPITQPPTPTTPGIPSMDETEGSPVIPRGQQLRRNASATSVR